MYQTTNKGGMGNEPFYKSRRIWTALLTLLTTIGIVIAPDQFTLIVGAASGLATALSLTSWVRPKKQ